MKRDHILVLMLIVAFGVLYKVFTKRPKVTHISSPDAEQLAKTGVIVGSSTKKSHWS
jgi:hypothetical protein